MITSIEYLTIIRYTITKIRKYNYELLPTSSFHEVIALRKKRGGVRENYFPSFFKEGIKGSSDW